jgi:hypothetical protein
MSKEELFKLYLKKNPTLSEDKITFTKNGIKKFFDTTYEVAYKQGFRQMPESDEDLDEDVGYTPHQKNSSKGLDDLMRIFKMS